MSWEGRKYQLELRYGGPDGKTNMEKDARAYRELGPLGRFLHILSGRATCMPRPSENSNTRPGFEEKKGKD